MELYENVYKCLERQDYDAAIVHIERLAAFDPKEAATLLVSLYIEQGDTLCAREAWEKLSVLQPTDFYTRFLYARILFMDGKIVSAYQELLKIKIPEDKKQGYGEKIANLLGQCCRILGKSQEAAEAYHRAASFAVGKELKALEYSNYLFNLHYSGEHKADFLREAAKGFANLLNKKDIFNHPLRRRAKGPWRIGYLSSDIRRHVILCFCYDLLTAYDHKYFSVYIYMLGTEDGYSQKVKQQVTGWRNLKGMPTKDAARVIYMDEIDILVDLAGHTKGNGLPIMAYKPAPVQLSGIGYFGSTGLPTVDYFLGDKYLDDERTQREFVEKLLVLPHSHFCYRPLISAIIEEPAFRRRGYVTFGSFNNFTKVNNKVLVLWRRLLEAVPNSHLLLKADVFDDGEVEEYTRKRLIEAGLPMERVDCRGISADYLSEYNDMDIALDTFPYPGGGTSCDALYMGRPLITLAGETHGERFGRSLLMNLGLGELVAYTEIEYLEKAIMLANDYELLQGLQENLRFIMQKSPLMNRQLYLQNMENFYRMIMEERE